MVTDRPGRGWWCCAGWGVRETSVAVEYAYRHVAEVGVCWQFAAEDPTVLRAQFAELAAQLGAREPLDVRDPVASVHAVWPGRDRVAAGLRQRDQPGVGAAVRAARGPGAGADHHPEPALATGRCSGGPGPGHRGRRWVPGEPDRGPGPGGGAGAGGGAGRAAAGPGAGRGVHAGHRHAPGPVPAAVRRPAGGPADPR